MNEKNIRTDKLHLKPAQEKSLRLNIINRLTRLDVCKAGEQTLLLRLPAAVSEPLLLNKVVSLRTENNAITYQLSDSTGEYKASLLIGKDSQRIRFFIELRGPQPVWLLEWKISGIRCHEVLVPALGGQAISDLMPEGQTLSYKYPFWLNAQFLIGLQKQGGLMISSEDPGPNMKLIRIQRDRSDFTLTYGFENTAPLKDDVFKAEWYMDVFGGSWQQAVDNHRTWLEKSLI